MDVVVIGSALVDLVARDIQNYKILTKNLKKYVSIPYGSKIEVEGMEFHVGGSGHNVATDLAKLGNKVSFVGKIGDDYLGKQIIDDFKKQGFNVKGIKVVKHSSNSLSFVFLLNNGEKSIVVYKGQELDLNVRDIPMKDMKKTKWLVFTSITSPKSLKFLNKTIELARKNRVKVLANPSIRMIRMKKKSLLNLIKKSDASVMNDEEIKELTGVKNIAASMKKLNKMGVKIVVVTLGKRGSVAYDGKKMYHKKGFKVKTVDSTGCGDSFTAGFLHYILKGKSIPESLIFGNANGAIEITDVGPKPLSEEKVLDFISKH
jgi:sugar/nucleoside kinase (ribokinase family)